jgi:hypothetical protein
LPLPPADRPAQPGHGASRRTDSNGSLSVDPSSVIRRNSPPAPRSTMRAGSVGVCTRPRVVPFARASANAFNAVMPPSPGRLRTAITAPSDVATKTAQRLAPPWPVATCPAHPPAALSLERPSPAAPPPRAPRPKRHVR